MAIVIKIGCAAANPQLLHGKPLYYGTIGLHNRTTEWKYLPDI